MSAENDPVHLTRKRGCRGVSSSNPCPMVCGCLLCKPPPKHLLLPADPRTTSVAILQLPPLLQASRASCYATRCHLSAESSSSACGDSTPPPSPHSHPHPCLVPHLGHLFFWLHCSGFFYLCFPECDGWSWLSA